MITAKQAEKEHEKLKSVWSLESKLSQKILIAILALLEQAHKPKRKPTAYNKFFAAEMKKGTPMSEIGKKWKART